MRMLDIEPQAPSLRDSAEQMLNVLDQRANAAALAMGLADEAYTRLQTEMENHEALKRQSEEFLRDGDEEAAQRCVALQLESAKEVNRLSQRYTNLQKEAEANVSRFRNEKAEVDSRVNNLPELEHDIRLVQAQERIQELTQLSLSNPQTAFDQAASEIRIRQRQIHGKEALVSDPNAELDRRIREATDRKVLERAMRDLRKRVGAQEVVDAEIIGDEDPMGNARKLLEAPRFRMLSLTSGTHEPARVLRVRKKD